MSKNKIKSLLSLFFFIIWISVSQAASQEQSPRFLVHLLDYLAQDYGVAVSNGKVINPYEYEEQIEFIDAALETQEALPSLAQVPTLTSQLKELKQLIQDKESPEKVSELARKIQSQVIELTKLEVAPAKWPHLNRGQHLFEQNCRSCHGPKGYGDGPLAQGLTPKPTNFQDQDTMKSASPFKAFNTIRLGVLGTAMTPFHGLSDKDVWDLAFYVVSLRHQKEKTSKNSIDESLLNKVASSSDEILLQDPQNSPEKISALRTHSGKENVSDTLLIAKENLNQAFEEYKLGHIEVARKKALLAYLEGVEPVEPRLKANDPQFVIDIEMKMATVRQAIESKKPHEEVLLALQTAEEALNQAVLLLEKKATSAWFTFLMALGIILREGFEAILIIIALLGVVYATGSTKAAHWIHAGWILAIVSGGIFWLFSGWLMTLSGAEIEILEAVTSLLAVIVLLYLGFWLHNKTEIHRWKSFIHGKVKKALEGSNLLGLFSLSFIAVFREAFETVLFLRAVWLESGMASKTTLALGTLTSFALLVVMAMALLKFSTRLPIRKLFGLSSSVILVLAVILTGQGLHALQEAGILHITVSPLNLRWSLLGFYPTLETLLSQGAMILLCATLWIYGSRGNQAGQKI